METASVSVNRYMYKQAIVYIYVHTSIQWNTINQ